MDPLTLSPSSVLDWERIFVFPHRNPVGAPAAAASLSPRLLRLLQKWCIRLALWIAGSHKALAVKALRRALHTMHPQSTRLHSALVGAVGNRGRQRHLCGLFSNSPEFHKRVLENPPAAQPPAAQPVQPDSHFSSSPTRTTRFFLKNKTKKNSRRRRATRSRELTRAPERHLG